MKFIACGGESSYFLLKTYTEKPFDEIMRDIGGVRYDKCQSCGFVLSKTHCELSDKTWQYLMKQWGFQSSIYCPPSNAGSFCDLK
jgi:hypothetical protein